MKKYTLSVLLGLTFFSSAALASSVHVIGGNRSLSEIKESGYLVIGTNAEYKPFMFKEPALGKDPITGFEATIVKEIAKRLGLKVKWVEQDFDVLLDNLTGQGAVDMVAASHTITPARELKVNFSEPYYCSKNVLVSRVGGPQTSKDLQSMRVGTTEGSIQLRYLEKLPLKMRIIIYPTEAKAMQAVADNETDVTVVDKVTALQFIKDSGNRLLVAQPQPLWKAAVGAGFRKTVEGDELRTAFNKAFQEVLNDGTYERVSLAYFGVDIHC